MTSWVPPAPGPPFYILLTALVQTLLKYKVDVRKEKELVCGNEEIANIIKLELRKSRTH